MSFLAVWPSLQSDLPLESWLNFSAVWLSLQSFLVENISVINL
jgi:hypothetical protein